LNFFETEMGTRRKGGTAIPKGWKPTKEIEVEDREAGLVPLEPYPDLNLLTLV